MDHELRIDGVPVTKIGMVVPISPEALADAVDLSAVWNRTPEEWRRADEERREREAEALRVATARHAAVLSVLAGRLVEVLELHRPEPGSLGVVCRGCEFEGREGEPPEWPCSTWVIAAGVGL